MGSSNLQCQKKYTMILKYMKHTQHKSVKRLNLRNTGRLLMDDRCRRKAPPNVTLLAKKTAYLFYRNHCSCSDANPTDFLYTEQLNSDAETYKK
jgi:hypothetical protein